MKKHFYKIGALALFASVLFTSCDPEIDAPTASKGEADFTKYVAVGNSLTAGYQDDGLYREGQLNSYPAILAEQFKLAGGGEFVQPLFTEAQASGTGYLQLTGFSSTGLPITARVAATAERGTGVDGKTKLYTEYLEPVNNLGVPGIKMADVKTPGYGLNNPAGFNPYYERLIGNDLTPTGGLLPYVNKVASTNPTFFTMWLGNNDVLSYATSGGQLGISSADNFQAGLDAMIATLTVNGAKGAVMNIPDVTGIPFFTAKATASLIQAAAAAKTNLFIRTGDGQTRPATVADYVLLTSTVGTPENVPGVGTVPHGFTPLNPLGNGEVLDAAEVTAVQAATTDFNTRIAAAAQAKNLAFVDMNAFFKSAQMVGGRPNLVYNGVAYTPAFISGNIFSLDGVHPTPRGYAIIANEIIRGINAKYKSSIPTVDETQYRAVLFP